MGELVTTIQELRGTYKKFTTQNPVLKNGQLAVVSIESDDTVGGFLSPSTGLKVGDGTHAFNDLEWLAGKEQLLDTGDKVLRKQDKILYMSQAEFDAMDKTTVAEGTEICITDLIDKADLSTAVLNDLNKGTTAYTTANTALITAQSALPKAGGTITGDLTVSGAETVNGILTAKNNTNLEGALTVSGLTTLAGDVKVSGKITDADGEKYVQFRDVNVEAPPFGTLENGREYLLGEVDAIELYFPVEGEDIDSLNGFYSILHFSSGTEPAIFYIDDAEYNESTCFMTGDDCKSGVFTPVANRSYTVYLWYDGENKRGFVIGTPVDGESDTNITIGQLSDTAPSSLKKIIYCKESEIPSSPEVGIEYACTDYIKKEDLDASLQAEIDGKADKSVGGLVLETDTTGMLSAADVTNGINAFKSGRAVYIHYLRNSLAEGYPANDSYGQMISHGVSVSPVGGSEIPYLVAIFSPVVKKGYSGVVSKDTAGSLSIVTFGDGYSQARQFYKDDGELTRINFNIFPASATEGTITDEYMKQVIAKRDRSAIIFNKELYWKMSTTSTNYIAVYAHTGYDGEKLVHKIIAIDDQFKFAIHTDTGSSADDTLDGGTI